MAPCVRDRRTVQAWASFACGFGLLVCVGLFVVTSDDDAAVLAAGDALGDGCVAACWLSPLDVARPPPAAVVEPSRPRHRKRRYVITALLLLRLCCAAVLRCTALRRAAASW
jgi:hypothetical protein